MPKFALIECEHVSVRPEDRQVFELEENGESQFSNFVDEMMANPKTESMIASALAILERSCVIGKSLPKTQFNTIKDSRVDCNIYEVKKKSKLKTIRIYMFQEKNKGRVVVMGGYKTKQQKDINTVVSKIKQFQDEKNQR